MFLIGEFRETEQVADAIRALRGNGVTPEELDVFSEEPVEFRHGVLDRPSRMSLAAVVGGVVLGSLATLGVYLAQHNYEVITGGMPVFSFWGTGVITYETTMMGAVFSTFGFFLIESRLLRKRDLSKPVPLVPPGCICLRVECKSKDSVEALMKNAGAVSVVAKGAA